MIKCWKPNLLLSLWSIYLEADPPAHPGTLEFSSSFFPIALFIPIPSFKQNPAFAWLQVRRVLPTRQTLVLLASWFCCGMPYLHLPNWWVTYCRHSNALPGGALVRLEDPVDDNNSVNVGRSSKGMGLEKDHLSSCRATAQSHLLLALSVYLNPSSRCLLSEGVSLSLPAGLWNLKPELWGLCNPVVLCLLLSPFLLSLLLLILIFQLQTWDKV